MKKFIAAFTLILFFTVVNAQQQNLKGTHTYTYVPESTLKIEDQEDGRINVSVERGKTMVFTYEFRKQDDTAIADDEYTMRIMFEVPIGATKFRYDAKDIKVVLMYIKMTKMS